MIMRKIFIMILMFACIGANAQVVYDRDPLLDNFQFQVRLISEFMSRLNGETSISAREDSLSREVDLISLFEKNTYITHKSIVEGFIRQIRPRADYVSFADTTWFAVAECVIEVGTRPVKEDTITIVLKTEEYGQHLYKWVMTEAFGDVLALNPENRNPGLKIPPSDNEVNFMRLSHITKNEQRNILNYACRTFCPDRMTIFYTMLYNGLMRVRYVSSLHYVFHISGYRLRVDYHRSDDRSGGWLISDIRPEIEAVNIDLPSEL